MDLPPESIVKVNDEIKVPVSLHSHSKSLSAIQLLASEIDSAKIFLPEGVIDGTYELNFKARVGASDGVISETGETRYNYTRMFEFSSSGNSTHETITPGDDLAWNSSGNVNYGEGDDVVFINDKGPGYLSGGDGEDAAIFTSVAQGKNVVIDLNKNEYLIHSQEKSIEDTTANIRNIDGFEILVGSGGDDTIVGNENDTSNLTIKGGAGDDYLVGGAGDDVIFGGTGNNLLAGGIGNNIFIIEANNSDEQILDFSSSDKIIFKGFNLNKIGEEFPSQFSVVRSNGDNSDWKLVVNAINTPNAITNSVLLEGSLNQFQTANELMVFLADRVEFNENLDLVGLNPFIEEFQMDVPVLDILQNSSSDRDSFFGNDLNFDDLSATLGILADVKYNEALIISDSVSGINSVPGFSGAVNDASYNGMSGSGGDDTLVAGEKDSVLYGGDGGSDRLIGGSGDDIILASGYADNGIDELTGGAGADMFSLINPSEINSTLQKIYEVKIEDFARTEGDRVVLVGYDETDTLELSSVDEASNIQTATISKSTNESLTIYFDLSFAREFDSNFTLRMADFDKIDAV